MYDFPYKLEKVISRRTEMKIVKIISYGIIVLVCSVMFCDSSFAVMLLIFGNLCLIKDIEEKEAKADKQWRILLLLLVLPGIILIVSGKLVVRNDKFSILGSIVVVVALGVLISEYVCLLLHVWKKKAKNQREDGIKKSTNTMKIVKNDNGCETEKEKERNKK